MSTIEELEKEIEEIKKRNLRVEGDKAWETSWARKVIILVLTYIVVVSFFFAAQLPQPFINAIVPVVAFFLSTLSLAFFRRRWLKKR